MSKETLDFVTPLAAEKLQNFFGVFLQFQIGVDSDEIIYVPDLDLNGISFGVRLDDEDIEAVLSDCYTGNDFLDECGGDAELAERLFDYCDWQHPLSALPEIDCEEDIPTNVR